MDKHFCTCPDTKCPKHPVNHSKGCNPCIASNLKSKDIPTCFFLAVHNDVTEVTDYSIDSFVQFYLQHKNG